MTVRSVIDIALQAQQWEKFQQEFDRYSEALRKQPELWRKISAEHAKLAGGFAKLGNATETHLAGLQDLKDVEQDQEKSLTHSASLWSDIQKSSASTSKNVIGATTSLLKWTGLLSGVAGLLGYFTLGGITDLGQDVFNWRKSASGLGLTTGQQRAFDISFARLLGSPEGFLGGINQAVTNYAAQGPLYALGVNPNQSTSQVAVSTLEALRQRVAGMSVPMLGQFEQAYGLGALGISVEDLRRLQSMSGPQFSQLLGTYRKQQSALNLSDQTTLAWTNFITGLDTAKAKIENVFVKDLVSLSGPIGKLAGSFANLLDKLGQKNGPISQAIDGIAKWMDQFNGQISKPKFISGLQHFVDLVSFFGSDQSGPAKFLNGLGATGPASGPGLSFLFNGAAQGADARSWWDRLWGAEEQWWHGGKGAPIGMLLNNPVNLKFAGQAGATLGPGGFAQFPSMQLGLNAAARQLELYASRGIDTVAGIVSTFAPAADRNNVPAYIQAIDKDMGVTQYQHLNLHDPKVLAELIRAIIRHEQGIGIDFGGGVSIAARNAVKPSINVKFHQTPGGVVPQVVSALGSTR